MSSTPPSKPSLMNTLRKAKSMLFTTGQSTSSTSETGGVVSFFTRKSDKTSSTHESLGDQKDNSTSSALEVFRRADKIAEETLKQQRGMDIWATNLEFAEVSIHSIGEKGGRKALMEGRSEIDGFIAAQKEAVNGVLRFLKELALSEGWREDNFVAFADNMYEELGRIEE